MTATPTSVTGAYVGTSGYSYPSWKPGFYPAETKPADFLRHYAERLPSVELNTTGYRLPAEGQFLRWAEQTPPGFRFAVKMPPRGVQQISTFEERVGLLGDRLGPVRAVIQSPRDDGLLELMLGSVDPAVRYAFDFRHESWEGVDRRLAEAGAVRVGAWDADAPFRYLRFREPPYSDAELEEAAGRIRPLLEQGVDVYVYFRHEDEPSAPAYAQRLLGLLGE